MTELTVTVTRIGNRRSVEVAFDHEQRTTTVEFAGDVEQSKTFEELAELLPGLTVLDDKALEAWNSGGKASMQLVLDTDPMLNLLFFMLNREKEITVRAELHESAADQQ